MFPLPTRSLPPKRSAAGQVEGSSGFSSLLNFPKESLEKVLTNDLKKILMVLFPLRGSSLKFTLCD
jgi:hypothetical protein